MDPIIEVTISPEGVVTFKTEGFTGASCEEATRRMEEALGGDKTSDERTPEFYNEETTKVSY